MDSLFSILVKKGPGEEEAQQDKAIFPNAAENEERKQTDAKKINPDQSALARTPSSWSQDPLTEFISLSERKRQMMLLIPIKNKRIQEKFRKIVSKVQIYLKIQQVVNDIKVYGTSSHLHFQKSLVRDLKFMALEGLGFQNLHKEPQKDTLDPSQPSKLGVCEISDTKIRIWNWFIAVMLVFSMIYVPFTAAFLDYSIGFVVIETLISIIFFIDAIVYCKVAFLNPYFELIFDQRQILIHNLKHYNVLDLLSIIPFLLLSSSQTMKIMWFWRIFKGVKLYIALNGELYYRKNRQIILFFVYIPLLLLIIHNVACLWYLIARIEEFTYDGWVMRHSMMNKSTWYKYLYTVYYASTTFTTVVFGDIKPVTQAEIAFSTVWILVAMGLFYFLLSQLTFFLSKVDTLSANIDKKAIDLDVLSQDKDISPILTQKIKRRIFADSQKHKKLSDIHTYELFQGFHKEERYLIATQMYNNAMKHIPFFKDQDDNFLAEIGPLLNLRRYEKHDVIFRANDDSEFICFIVRGHVTMLTAATNVKFRRILEGGYFGDIDFFASRPRSWSTLASKNWELLMMNKPVLELVEKSFGSVYEEMKSVAKSKQNKFEQCLKEVEDLINSVNA